MDGSLWLLAVFDVVTSLAQPQPILEPCADVIVSARRSILVGSGATDARLYFRWSQDSQPTKPVQNKPYCWPHWRSQLFSV